MVSGITDYIYLMSGSPNDTIKLGYERTKRMLSKEIKHHSIMLNKYLELKSKYGENEEAKEIVEESKRHIFSLISTVKMYKQALKR
jgi:hypothetical protein